MFLFSMVIDFQVLQRVVCITKSMCSHACCSLLQFSSVCCRVLQCVAVCCSVLQSVTVCCSVLQSVAVCCRVLQCVAVRHTRLHLERCTVDCVPVFEGDLLPGVAVLQRVVCIAIFRCSRACCSLLQFSAACCSVLQCVMHDCT